MLRRLLRFLWDSHGAPRLDRYVPKLTPARPRNVTATREQIEAMLAHATPCMRAFITLCSDLAIRSGTVTKIAPEHYNPENQTLSFVTKKDARVTLATTAAVREIIAACDLSNPLPFVTQLRQCEAGTRGRHMKHAQVHAAIIAREFTALRIEAGIIKRITPHDLRRTAAVATLRYTNNLRTVQSLLGHRSLQSTIWYLDHDLYPVDTQTLEAIKKPHLVWSKDRPA
ncbi:MAG: tyrosine-type recombinase/integrase [Acidobacteria bacterium]|nr:tyrosine-type recombinase/integrase [Acidobacteriota bacterium]